MPSSEHEMCNFLSPGKVILKCIRPKLTFICNKHLFITKISISIPNPIHHWRCVEFVRKSWLNIVPISYCKPEKWKLDPWHARPEIWWLAWLYGISANNDQNTLMESGCEKWYKSMKSLMMPLVCYSLPLQCLWGLFFAFVHVRWCNIRALPGAVRLLKHLNGHGVPMALASNSPRESIEAKISYHHGTVHFKV